MITEEEKKNEKLILYCNSYLFLIAGDMLDEAEHSEETEFYREIVTYINDAYEFIFEVNVVKSEAKWNIWILNQ